MSPLTAHYDCFVYLFVWLIASDRVSFIFSNVTITFLLFHGRSSSELLVSSFMRTAFNEHAGGSLSTDWKSLHGQRALRLWLGFIALLEPFFYHLLWGIQEVTLTNPFTPVVEWMAE